jgi:hypothetical protein
MLTQNVLADTKRHRAHIPNRVQIIVTDVATSYNSPSSLASFSVVLLCTDRCHTEIKIFGQTFTVLYKTHTG